MFADIIVLVALGILTVALVWLLARLMSVVRVQRQWRKGWGELADQYGMTFESGQSRCSLAGMYRGRIIYLLGTFRSGINIHMTTSNYTSNTLQMKARSLPPSLRNPDNEALFNQGFAQESGSKEFMERVFVNQELRRKMAPLAHTPGLAISLSGEELSLAVPRLYTRSDELLRFLDPLSDLASAIEDVRFVNGVLH